MDVCLPGPAGNKRPRDSEADYERDRLKRWQRNLQEEAEAMTWCDRWHQDTMRDYRRRVEEFVAAKLAFIERGGQW